MADGRPPQQHGREGVRLAGAGGRAHANLTSPLNGARLARLTDLANALLSEPRGATTRPPLKATTLPAAGGRPPAPVAIIIIREATPPARLLTKTRAIRMEQARIIAYPLAPLAPAPRLGPRTNRVPRPRPPIPRRPAIKPPLAILQGVAYVRTRPANGGDSVITAEEVIPRLLRDHGLPHKTQWPLQARGGPRATINAKVAARRDNGALREGPFAPLAPAGRPTGVAPSALLRQPPTTASLAPASIVAMAVALAAVAASAAY